MSAIKNIVGQRFGRLTVVERSYVPDKKWEGRAQWICACDCGNTKITPGKQLRNGTVTSCGCKKKEGLHTTHGMGGIKPHRLYTIWSGMKQGCNYKKIINWKNYGGRGIKLDPRWERFENFLADMGMSYEAHVLVYGKMQTTLDRIDNDGSYSKDNCRWATRKEQVKNSRQGKK